MTKEYIKHPRTLHIPQSKGIQSDDKVHNDLSMFIGKQVVITEKDDGECTSCYDDGYIHARSIDGNSYEWQSLLKRMWSQRFFRLPSNYHLTLENLYAKHSIAYDLGNYAMNAFPIFVIWDENNNQLTWDKTEELSAELQLKMVPVLFQGMFDEKVIKQLIHLVDSNRETMEGFVIKIDEPFHISEWSNKTGKYVREGHVQTDIHWRKHWKPNKSNFNASTFN